MTIKKYVFMITMVLAFVDVSRAHEPLYGFGPHVLFKGGFAPRITLNGTSEIFETEYALGYGVTRAWTMIAETPWRLGNGKYSVEGVNLKSKYRFWLRARQGVSYQASFISKLEVPVRDGRPTVLNLALTTGQEALRLYWFATAGYALKFTDDPLKPGNHVFYNVSIGYRPFRVNYYKPDIVFFIETTGNIFQKSMLNGDKVTGSGGANLAIAPTFFFTYRNLALRGGVQFGVWDNGYVSKPETNYKLTFEIHI